MKKSSEEMTSALLLLYLGNLWDNRFTYFQLGRSKFSSIQCFSNVGFQVSLDLFSGLPAWNHTKKYRQFKLDIRNVIKFYSLPYNFH